MSHRVTSSRICCLLSSIIQLPGAHPGFLVSYQIRSNDDSVSRGLDTRFDVQDGLLDHVHDGSAQQWCVEVVLSQSSRDGPTLEVLRS